MGTNLCTVELTNAAFPCGDSAVSHHTKALKAGSLTYPWLVIAIRAWETGQQTTS